MLEVLLIYPHSPLGAVHPQDRAYISVKPLTAVLQPINVPPRVSDKGPLCYNNSHFIEE